ncbi:hypothetical protein CP02DC18_1235 [Chlamydia psittaci 02DC18]|nr:hypothetical protein CP02DC18_1235 [Chlamydia psittaci 02DC18]
MLIKFRRLVFLISDNNLFSNDIMFCPDLVFFDSLVPPKNPAIKY